jgi:cyanoexosortase B-associated protein
MQSLFKQKSKLLIIIVGLLIMLISAIPSYFSQNWIWQERPLVRNLSEIKSLRTNKIEFPGFETIEQQEISIGGGKWSLQLLQKEREEPLFLFLLTPNDLYDKPEVEWIDMNGFQKWDFSDPDSKRWKTDSYRHLTVEFAEKTVKTRFFRGWNIRQTFAVVQWYAFPSGGSPSPVHWFWSDFFAQLKGQRIPWIAVSLQIPIEPLGDIEKVEPLAKSLVENIQMTLTEKYFSNQ